MRRQVGGRAWQQTAVLGSHLTLPNSAGKPGTDAGYRPNRYLAADTGMINRPVSPRIGNASAMSPSVHVSRRLWV
jgi:hypothetical protein